MTQQLTTRTDRRPASRAGNVTLWVLQILTAAFFAMAGVGKLSGADPAVRLFDDIGAGQWLRYVVGALEVAGAIGLLIPRLAGLAALGLVGVMVGAVATEIFIVSGNPVMALILLALVAVVAWGRRDRTAALLQR